MTILLATLVWSGHATVASLLLVTFFLAIGGALVAPAWMAITPLLVNRGELDGAIAANGVGYNITRAVGPVAGGFIIAGFGMAAPFFICAASNLAAIAALLWWRAPQKSAESLPAERLVSAMRTGIRHAANNRHLRATLVRAFAFFPFASAYWALLPLVARNQTDRGSGTLRHSARRDRRRRDRRLVRAGLAAGEPRARPARRVRHAGDEFALLLFGFAHNSASIVCACLIAGASWTCSHQPQRVGPGRLA